MSALPFFCSVPVFDPERYKLVCRRSDLRRQKVQADRFYLVFRAEWDYASSDTGTIQFLEASFQDNLIRLKEVDGSAIIVKEVPYKDKRKYVEISSFLSFNGGFSMA